MTDRRLSRGKAWDRNTPRQGLSGRPWRRLRQRILERDCYLCLTCQAQGRVTEATAVDHVTPVSKGGSDDPNNLASICDPCHALKTLADEGRRAPRPIGVDGYPVGFRPDVE